MKNTLFATTCAIAVFATSQAIAAPYSTTGTTNGVSVSANASTSVFYTPPTDGSSDRNYPSITLDISGAWDFVFNADNSVDFTGNIFLGDYETQTNVSGFVTIDGHQVFRNVNHQVSGTGSYNESTNTFTFSLPSGGANSSIASIYTADSSSCQNGRTSFFGNVCSTFSGTTPEYEGLDLEFVFSEDRSTFSGSIAAIEQSGSGLTANTTTVRFNVDGVSEVPVPAAAWLFGSALIGLAGLKRRQA